ncbi:hypothetical protein IE53DRAFT_386267 [Violaceomyces palustris]|uniref:Uncharacterized protein n=1 Tax=Violaceomyces palustris TaxID=1673888 RepID=A0ACD0P018_9BASI|nr:hypothetical protein IE53DRAFT_386267 [Violaceomyces palustris]
MAKPISRLMISIICLACLLIGSAKSLPHDRLEKRVPVRCGQCSPGEALIYNTNNDYSRRCTVSCQSGAWQSEPFSGPISPYAMRVTQTLAEFLTDLFHGGGMAYTDISNYKRDSGDKYSGLLEADGFQVLQRMDSETQAPLWAVQQESSLHAIIHANLSMFEHHDRSIPLNNLDLKRDEVGLSYDQIIQLLYNSTESDNTTTTSGSTANTLTKRTDPRGVTAVKYHATYYKYANGGTHPMDPWFAVSDAWGILYGMTALFQTQREKNLCTCAADSAFDGQTFDFQIDASMGNGKFQKKNCPPCNIPYPLAY